MTRDSERLPWFPCNPTKLLGALSEMEPDVGYVYVIVLLRIYEQNGPCKDQPSALARRTGYKQARVTKALSELVAAGRLVSTEAGYINPKAEEVLAEQKSVRVARKTHGKNGADKRWGKDKQSQRSPDSRAMADDADSELDLEKKDSGGVAAPAPEPKPKVDKGTRIRNDWTLTPERLAYGLGRGLTEREVRRDAEKFVNYWRAQTGQKGVKAGDAGWEATWRNWCISSAERLGREPRAAVNGHDGTLDPRKFTHDAWRDALKVWRLTNNWNPRFGPEPGKAGCLVPSELLQPRLV